MGRVEPSIRNGFFIHPNAICDSTHVGARTRVWGFSHVMKDAVIGMDCNIGEHVYIEDRVIIGDRCTVKNGVAIWECVVLESDVFVGPYAVFTNDFTPRAFIKRTREHFLPTLLKRGCSVGANATLVCGITVGEYAIIGAGSVVIRDVAPHALVVGNPGRVIGKVCFCGEKLGTNDACIKCGIPLAQNSIDLVRTKIEALK